MREVEFANQPVECARFFERIQVFPLNVLHQRRRYGRIIVNISDDCRNLCQSCHLCGTPAPLAGHDLVALCLTVFLL
jgi:hypothetical protein